MLKRHISIGVFVVYIDTGSPVPYISSKSHDLADEKKKNLMEWKWFETTVLSNTLYYIILMLTFRRNMNNIIDLAVVWLWVLISDIGSNKLQCYLVMYLILHFWYLIHVERPKDTVTVQTLTSQMMPMKTIRTMLVSAIFRQFGSLFGIFDIAG
jgi:hypothetical protein